MELLTRPLKSVRRLFSPNGWFSVSVLVFLVALEALGRIVIVQGTDLWDLLLGCTPLVMLGAFIVYRHRSSPLSGASRFAGLGRRLYDWLWSWTFELGIDMRGTPRIKRGFPPAVVALTSLLVAWFVALGVVGDGVPQVAREFGARYFY